MIDSITERTTVLAAHSRLARWLFFQYAARQKNAGGKLWIAPEILPFNAWLKKTWTQSWPKQYVLSSLQSRQTWEKIINSDRDLSPANLLHVRGAANQAARAFSLLKEYRVPADPEPFKWTTESRSFLRWKREYERQLAAWGALDPADVLDSVKDSMERGEIPLPDKLLLAGFAEVAPQLQEWLDFLKAKNVPVQFWPPQSQTLQSNLDRIPVREYKDQNHEAVQCARWIRGVFKPHETVGVVVLELEKYRSLLKRELSAELAPGSVFPWLETESKFSVSGGTSLANEPLVTLALQIISVESEALPFALFSSLLATPFLAGNRTEAPARRSLDLQLRRENVATVHLGRIEKKIDKGRSPNLDFLARSLTTLVRDAAKKPPSLWARELSLLLKRLGWPAGDDAPASSAYQNQAQEAWKDCLDEFASLDRILGNVPRRRAAETLSQIAGEKSFQVKTGERPIQIVSFSEAYGMQFDHLWIMGCHAEVLPSAPSSNPFIPLELQKKRNLPHSAPARELQWAERILDYLALSSRDAIISFPARSPKNELRISPLLRTSARSPGAEIAASCRLKDQLRAGTEPEDWQDRDELPARPEELGASPSWFISGGHKVLKDQADCPFRAFAAHRLGAEKLETPEIDFDSRERGSLAHAALQAFWSEVKTSANLRSLKETNQLGETVKTCVREAGNSFFQKLIGQKQFANLESERVASLLTEWLEKESLRPDFEVVCAEKSEEIRVGRLDLKVRIDRIDKTHNGHILLIDYKTGRVVPPKNWFEERLQEPQLPLYALKVHPDAVAFAEIKKGEDNSGFKLLAKDGSVMPGFKTVDFTKAGDFPDWRSLMAFWEKRLTELAEDFVAGKAAVDPFDAKKTCKHCGLQTLCRIEERKLSLRDDEDNDEEAP